MPSATQGEDSSFIPLIVVRGGNSLSMNRPVLNRCLLLIAAFAGLVGFGGEKDPSRDDLLVGGEFTYTVRSGDSLTAVGARFGVEPRSLAERNHL